MSSAEDLKKVLEMIRAYGVSLYGPDVDVCLKVYRPDGQEIAHIQAPRGPSPTARTHSADFRMVTWDGVSYSFSEPQAAAVELLWSQTEAGCATGATAMMRVAHKAGATCEKPSDLFRRHPAWGTLIAPTARGLYVLGGVMPTVGSGDLEEES